VSNETQEQNYIVVINGEDQYSIWPAYRDPPPGWTACHQGTSKAECMAYIKEHWVDMRPRSLRVAMADISVA
jgi:MbtH protein